MSFLPDNTTLQLGDDSGNIIHQGVLGSNVVGTQVLTPTFPTTSTGSSLGHYHYSEPTTNALQFLNVSGAGTGGHKFYTANSTTAPVNTASIGLDGFTIDKSTSGTPPVYSPNVDSLSGNGVTIVFPFGTDLNAPPYSLNQTFNPIYITQTTANFTAGQLAYAVLASGDSIQIFSNDNIGNPIPPNVVPTGFPVAIPNTGVTLGIPIFSLSLPTPSVPQIINIDDNITLTTGTQSCSLSASLLRNSTIKTTLNMENNTLQFVNGTGTTTTTMASDSYQIDNQPESVGVGFGNNRVFVTQTATNVGTNIYAGQLQQTDLPNNNQTVLTTDYLDCNLLNTNQKTRLTSSSLRLNDLTTNVSILSPTDLTFNGISLVNQVDDNTTDIDTNTTDIATNSSNIATNTTNITKNTNSISKLQYANAINIANSPAIYGTLPSSPPMIPTTNAINTGFNGWYYRNVSSVYNNISWSTGFQPSSYVVSNLKGFYFTFVSLTTTSKPFMSVYTLPAQPPGGFYNSRRSYVPALAPATITAGIPYIYYFMYDNNYPTPFKYCHTAVPLTLSGVNPVGAFGDNELLYFMSINTNSLSPANTEELIIGESGVIIDDGTGTLIQPFSFNSANVYSPNSYRAVQRGAGTLTPTISDNGTTYIATANFTISNAGLTGVPAGFFIIVQGTTVDRTITYNTSATKTVHTNTGTTNASQVIFYWLGDTFVAYQ
jgi:hypothetical protein